MRAQTIRFAEQLEGWLWFYLPGFAVSFKGLHGRYARFAVLSKSSRKRRVHAIPIEGVDRAAASDALDVLAETAARDIRSLSW